MKTIMILGMLLLYGLVGAAQAGEIREVVLKDGSIITGEVLSLADGFYTVKSDSLGVIRLEESKVRIIRESSASESLGVSKGRGSVEEITAIQEKMMNDQEVMSLIQSLQNDPEFKKLLEDPAILEAVNTGDILFLMGDPRFIKLLNNLTVQKIQEKVK